MTHDDFDDEAYDLRVQERLDRRYRAALARHPDCRDPDHPGCDQCEEDEE